MRSSAKSPSDPVRRALSISVFEGSLHAVMLGVSESYLGAFAVELGHGAEHLALLATLPLFFGAVCQFLTGSLSRRLGRKRLSILGAGLQGLSHLGFIAIALSGDARLWTLLLTKTVFWISGAVMAPAWSDWIASLTSSVSREAYFARRSAIVHVCLLIAFGLAGFLLNASDAALETYALLFSIGLLARLSSSAALWVQADLDEADSTPGPSTLVRTQSALRDGQFRVVVYLGLLMFGASVAIPFFTPYMLKQLSMAYQSFALLSAASILTKALTFPLCRRASESLGLKNLLVLSGLGVASVPLLWALSPRFEYLIVVHVVSGAAWAGLEFSSFQLLMTAVRAELRTEFFSLSNAFSGLLQVIGSVTGGFLLRSAWLSYTNLFLLSALLRALPLLLLLAVLPRLRFPKRLFRLPTRLLSVRPSAGASQRPILPATPGTKTDPLDD